MLVVVVLMQMIFVKHFLGCLDDCRSRLVDFDSPTTCSQLIFPCSKPKEKIKVKIWNNSIPYPSTYIQQKSDSELGDLSWCGRSDYSPATPEQRPLHAGIRDCRNPGIGGCPPCHPAKATAIECLKVDYRLISIQVDYTQRQVISKRSPNCRFLIISVALQRSMWSRLLLLPKSRMLLSIFQLSTSSLLSLW